MDSRRRPSDELKVLVLSSAGGFLAPLVFVAVIALRKVSRRLHVRFRFWNKRLQHEVARWS